MMPNADHGHALLADILRLVESPEGHDIRTIHVGRTSFADLLFATHAKATHDGWSLLNLYTARGPVRIVASSEAETGILRFYDR